MKIELWKTIKFKKNVKSPHPRGGSPFSGQRPEKQYPTSPCGSWVGSAAPTRNQYILVSNWINLLHLRVKSNQPYKCFHFCAVEQFFLPMLIPYHVVQLYSRLLRFMNINSNSRQPCVRKATIQLKPWRPTVDNKCLALEDIFVSQSKIQFCLMLLL